MSLKNMHLSDHTDKNISEICLYMTSTLFLEMPALYCSQQDSKH